MFNKLSQSMLSVHPFANGFHSKSDETVFVALTEV